MKLYKKLLILLSCMLVLACVGCGEENESRRRSRDRQDRAEEVAVENKQAEEEQEETVEAQETEADNEVSVSELYDAFLNGELEADFGDEQHTFFEDWEDDYNCYTFWDLDNDGTDELLLQLYGSWLNVFTVRDGQVCYVESPFYTGASRELILEDGYVMLVDESHGGRNYYEIVHYDNGAFESIVGYTHAFSELGDEWADSEYYRIEIDGEDLDEISKEEYLKEKNGYLSRQIDLDWETMQTSPMAQSSLLITENVRRKMDYFSYLDNLCMAIPYDYESELGQLFEEYDGFAMSDTDRNCQITRSFGDNEQQVYYTITSENGEILTTEPFDNYPNTVETFEFADADYDGVSEVLVTSHTDGTGGWVATSAWLYKFEDGAWKEYCVYDFDAGICNDKVNADLMEMSNARGTQWEHYHVRDVVIEGGWVRFLVDFGDKMGAEVIMDYTGAEIKISDPADAGYVSDGMAESSWPFDF